jgi:PAS domain S-box-containing protein
MTERNKIITDFIVILGMLILIGIYSYVSTNKYKDASFWVSHTQETISEATSVLSTIQGIESNTRGYVITGDKKYLEPYLKNVANIEAKVIHLKNLARDNPSQQMAIDSVKDLILLKKNFSNSVVSLRRDSTFQRAQQLISSNTGEDLMTKISLMLNKFIDNEKELLSVRLVNTQKSFKVVILIITVGIIITVAFIIVILLYLLRVYDKKNDIENELGKYLYFFNHTHDLACIANLAGYFEIVNPQYKKVLGYSEKELVSNKFTDFIHPDDLTTTFKELEQLELGNATINFTNRYRKKDGTYVWFEWNSTPQIATNKIYALARDVTERKKYEKEIIQARQDAESLVEKLKESNERNKIFLEQLPGAIAMFDLNMHYLAVSEQWIKDYNLAETEIIGRSHYEIFPEIADDRKAIHNDCLRGNIKRDEGHFERQDGTSRWIAWDIRPWYVSKNNIGGLLIYREDITDRKHAEDVLKDYIAMESKRKEMEQFIYVASHHLREPLLTVKNYVEMFTADFKDRLNTDAIHYLEVIHAATNRMDSLIKGLLDYSRLGEVKNLERVDCNKVMQRVLADLDTLIITNNASVCVETLPVLNAYPLELALLFQNLVRNAIKFKIKGVFPQINITATPVANGWEFNFSDNGIGIEEKDREKVFTIFLMLHNKNEYEGTGIGLSQCKKIVELHHGLIWIKSTPRTGSVFCFTILT